MLVNRKYFFVVVFVFLVTVQTFKFSLLRGRWKKCFTIPKQDGSNILKSFGSGKISNRFSHSNAHQIFNHLKAKKIDADFLAEIQKAAKEAELLRAQDQNVQLTKKQLRDKARKERKEAKKNKKSASGEESSEDDEEDSEAETTSENSDEKSDDSTKDYAISEDHKSESSIANKDSKSQKSSKPSSQDRKKRPNQRIRLTYSKQPDFALVGIKGVQIEFQGEPILRNASFTVATGERVGIVGPNGAGKSTVLRIITGDIKPNTGEILKQPSDLRLAFLRQEFVDELNLNNTLIEEVLRAFSEEQSILDEIKAKEEEISNLAEFQSKPQQKHSKASSKQQKHQNNHHNQKHKHYYQAKQEEEEEMEEGAGTEQDGYYEDGDGDGGEGEEENRKSFDELSEELRELRELANAMDANNIQSKAEKICNQMGFISDDFNSTVGSFSGGWKMRIGLAKVLASDPNVLLLDEPTNHMDFDSVLWLEDFLKRQTIPIIVVSHDREFLNQITNKIVEVEKGFTYSYPHANYNSYLMKRHDRLTIWRERYKKQQKYISDELHWLKKAKNNPSINANTIKNRENALRRYQSIQYNPSYIPYAPPRDKRFQFRFPLPPRYQGEILFEAKDIRHGYGDGKYATLFEHVNFEIRKGNRIGFVGPNGSGKSTMLRLILGQEKPLEGKAEIPSSRVIMNYYAQNSADSLALEDTIYETIANDPAIDLARYQASRKNMEYDEGNNMIDTMNEIRTLLAQFCFSKDDIYKKIQMLSGGEKARVALCKMMLTPANLLVLDEPTNHLDIVSKEVLEDALVHYPGSVVMVSHDRYFMSQVCNTIFEFGNQRVLRYDCDYHDFLEIKARREAEAVATGKPVELAGYSAESRAFGFFRDETDSEADTETETDTDSDSSGDEDSDGEEVEQEEGQSNGITSAADLYSGKASTAATSNVITIKDKITSRYLTADAKYRIGKAKKSAEITSDIDEMTKQRRRKNFGGSNLPSGDKFKGIKNAKRYKDL